MISLLGVTILGSKLSGEAAAWMALFVASEVIGTSKLKENSVVQVGLKAVRLLKPFRTEDNKLQKIKDALK